MTELTRAELERELARHIAPLVGIPAGDIDPDGYLDELGLSSRDAVVLAGELEQLLGRTVAPTIAWEAPTIRQLAELLLPVAETPALRVVTSEAQARDHEDDDRIAIVGLGCRLPGGIDGPDAYWEVLRDGVDVVGEVPPGRWERAGVAADGDVPRHGAFLDDITGFDAEWFGITPREAALMDPQQRLLLETSVDALRHARLDPVGLRGSRTGVYVGISGSEYATLTATRADTVEFWTATGGALSIAANRVSYALDLRGPSMALDSACSSSLAALHSAAVALRAGDCSLALAGGVNVLLTPLVTAAFERGGVLAADGRCKSFAADADGIGRGEGCGVVVLERLADARANGHRVLALVAGSAVNSDGRSNGLTAPNASAQEDVLRRAYESAGIAPGGVDYVEAHGTGTPLGDPIEAAALGRVLGAGREGDRPLLLGSVKSNLGHLEAAAGIASVIKVVLAMRHDLVPATLHADVPNPHLTLAEDHIELVTTSRSWPRYDGVARAGVSGFGFGGTNAHVVIEQADDEPALVTPAAHEHAGVATAHLVAVSGRTPARARAAAARLADWLGSDAGAGTPIAAVARSSAHRAEDGATRIAVAAAGPESAAAALRKADPVAARPGADRPVFVFAGYGQQWDGMGRELIATEPAFAEAADAACDALASHGVHGIGKLLRLGRPPADMVETMAAIFAVQLGLAAWWRSVGVTPAAVLGQSLGEVAAAVVAGAVNLDDGARIMAVRARLLAGIDAQDAGAMALLDVPADLVRSGAASVRAGWPDVEVAVVAAPSQCTVAGPAEQVHRLVDHIESRGHDAWLLPVATAGHTSAVDPVLPPMRAQLAHLPTARPQVGWFSTVADDPRATPAFDAGYWAANARRPVRLAAAVTAALADGYDTFVEIAAHTVASPPIRRTVTDLCADGTLTAEQADLVTVIGSLRRDDERELARSAAALHAAGHPALLREIEPDGPRVDLPASPWQHRDHWFRPETESAPTVPTAAPELPAGAVLADGAVRVWTSDVVDLPEPADIGGTGGIVAGAALADAAARAAGLAGTVSAVSLDVVAESAAATTAAMLSCTRTGDGAEIELLHHGGGGGGSWVRSLHARVTLGANAVPLPEPAPAASPAASPIAATIAADDRIVLPVLARLRETLVRVMGADDDGDADWLDDDVPLVDLGLDSLMAARARHSIEADHGVSVPARLLVQGITLRGLAAHIEGSTAGTAGTASTSGGPAPSRVGPRDPAERFVAAVVARELDLADPGVTDDLRPALAAAGAGALERIRLAVAERGSTRLDAAALLRAGTIEAVAELIRDDVEAPEPGGDRVLRTLRGGAQNRRPLFLFHPAGGTCGVYRPLLDLLERDLPVYGLDRLGDVDSVEERAARYVELLRRVQPHGPYRMIGWSFGGLLAGECAHRLSEAGEQVELLASIDTTLPRREPDVDDAELVAERFRRFAEHLQRTYGATVAVPDGIGTADDRTQLRLMQEAMLAGGVRLPAGVLRHQLTSYADARLAEHYTPPRWPHGMVLYRAQQVEPLTASLDPRYDRDDATLGWDAFVDDLDIVSVPGNHITMIDSPHVEVVARDLTARLAHLDVSSPLNRTATGLTPVRSPLPVGGDA